MVSKWVKNINIWIVKQMSKRYQWILIIKLTILSPSEVALILLFSSMPKSIQIAWLFFVFFLFPVDYSIEREQCMKDLSVPW